MVYKGHNGTYDFRKFKTINAFGDKIRNNIINMYMVNIWYEHEQNHLVNYIKEFKSKTRPQHDSNLKKVKEDILNSATALLKRRKMVFKAFESGIFS